MFKKLFFIFFQLIVFTCFGAQKESVLLSEEETVVLERFFRACIEETEGGYVLLGQKPVCAHGYNKEQFAVVSPWHSNSVALWEGARVWKKLSPTAINPNILIYIENEEKLSGWVHLSLINRSAFLKVVNDNHPLFQYVLGPRVTAEGLLKNIGSSFDKALHTNKVLIGIVLGYGEENALYGSRIEDVDTYLTAVEDIPLKHEKYSPEEQLEGFFLPKPGTRYSYNTVSPSFGFNDLSEEVNDLRNLITVSSDKLENVMPNFIFGHIKDAESQILINKLEKTQDKIRKFLTSKTFLQDVLEKTLGRKILINESRSFRFDVGKKAEISKIIARGIWEQELCDYEKEFIPYFIDALASSSLEEECNPLLTVPSLFRDISEVQKKLAETATLFCSLEKQKDVECVVPNKLYYKILNPGENSTECQSPNVRLKYTFFDSSGHCLQHQADATVNLNSTISGFAHGIKGMKRGETREIYIHPSLAYGTYTPYEKGLQLRSVVTLIEEIESNSPFPELVSMDLSFLSDASFLNGVRKGYKDILVWNGYSIGAHLRKSKDVDLESIKSHLQNFLQEKESFSPLTSEEKDLINKVHWNVYFAK